MNPPKKISNLLYSVSIYLCNSVKRGRFIPLDSNKSYNFRIYPSKVFVVSNSKKNIRRCLEIFLYSNKYYPTESIIIKFENDKITLFKHKKGNRTVWDKNFLETDEWKWFFDNLKLKLIEIL